MGWYAKKEKRFINGGVVGNVYSTMLLFCKNQNKKNLLIKKICTISPFFKLMNFEKVARFS